MCVRICDVYIIEIYWVDVCKQQSSNDGTGMDSLLQLEKTLVSSTSPDILWNGQCNIIQHHAVSMHNLPALAQKFMLEDS